LCPSEDAERIAEGAAAMIDGLYIRQSLRSAPISIDASIALTEDYINALLAPLPRKAAFQKEQIK
jgi:TetR/AcrR family transcriptional repressor of bet genes